MQRARSWLGALRSQDRPPRKIKYYGPEEHRPALRYDRAPRYDLYTLDTLVSVRVQCVYDTVVYPICVLSVLVAFRSEITACWLYRLLPI